MRHQLLMTITLLGRFGLADVGRVASFYMRVEAGRSGRGATWYMG